jgi:glutamate dehydrogenase
MTNVADSQQRTARLAELQDSLSRRAAPEDREQLRAFAATLFAALPDAAALGLSMPALAQRVEDSFRFFARDMPPASQLYRGLPGIHVNVRNPAEGEDARTVGGKVMPFETTVVETHTLDAPFIFESLKNYFRKQGLRVFAAIHPIYTVRRQWERIVWIGGPAEEGTKELLCQFRILRVDSRDRLRRIQHEIHAVLKSVFMAVEDFPDLLKHARDLAPRLRSRRGVAGEAESARAFLEWLTQENYIFMGSVRYRMAGDGQPHRIAESATGVFADDTLLPVVYPGLIEELEPLIKPAPGDDRIVDIDYCNNATALHHLEPLDDIVIREWDAGGNLVEATLFVGRFAKVAFTQKASDIPLLRQKQDWLLKQSGAMPNGHEWREIRALFNRFNKRELFYADVESLKRLFDAIVAMTGDDELYVDLRRGTGYVTLYVAFSRVRYSYDIEEQLRRALEDEYGPITYTFISDLGVMNVMLCYFDAARLEREIELDDVRGLAQRLLTSWEDQVEVVLERTLGDREGRRLFARYISHDSRSGLYRESTKPEEVPEDIRRLEALETRLEVSVLPRTSEAVTLKIFSVAALGLGETLRTLQNLGVTVTDEMRVPLALPENRKALLYRLEIEASPERIAALTGDQDRFIDALRAVDEGHGTDDALNALVLSAGLTWRQVEVLRTLRNHVLQVRPHYNVETVNGVMLRNNKVSGALYRLFAARFDPDLAGDRAAAVQEAETTVRKELESVRSLAEDEVLRALDNLIRCGLRTNFYQRPQRPVISIKVDSRKVEGMPSPRPMFEIYVHSPLIEGIHLRGGKVARGGIRWSDRHDDFRTEVLGLMKTQMTKNCIIVPVGSKGGFVLKGNVPSRPALDGYLIDRYREFISGLLDVTDNIVDGGVVHPPDVVRHDADDPYLVVAADKGTAHLSDTANSVSAQYGFWLGDAFASGGSVGYDHKKVGITARGAWECVKHHFHNMGRDCQTQDFTCVGIGDLMGDVFGNGMLMSRKTKLLAAFNHLHIFLDPQPDPERTYVERERMFRLPRSSWRDYDPSLISAGGGVFDRSAKSIPLSPQVREMLGVQAEAASGEEVIRAILRAPVDLLYNGGIGTYVKSQAEEDADVGDRANDRVRVDAAEVRAKVVGEGGNLGLTQRARLEYSTKGGHINTDAVDNSGGVDMSDHEVNIKILMDLLVKKAVIGSREERNRILAEMTEEVAELVLADNDNQARALTLDNLRSRTKLEEFVAFIDEMAAAGILDKADQAIPSREELLATDKAAGLPRPLLAVLLQHAKMWYFEKLLETDFAKRDVARPLLENYFPRRIRESYGAHLDEHRLRKEIVCTVAINHLLNNAGMTFVSRVMSATGKTLADVVAAYLAVDVAAGASPTREKVVASPKPAEAQHGALLQVEEAIEAATRDSANGGRVDAAALQQRMQASAS